ncbi:BRO family protein [Plantactinospora sp. CA-294935]|uniref:BRO family protein n=1 Tax=Plantactinospora sp. CA-294935 TaxID=3240012 RepID=UPI003D8E5816
MIAEIEVFQFPATGQQIRTLLRNGEPWFVAADVCTALDINNSRQAVSYLDEDEKGVTTNDTPGGQQQVSVVSEPGLYSLILRSRKPQAKEFKRWVTHEVLPAIRKTGRYEGASQFAIPQTYSEALRLAATQAEEIEAQRARLAVAEPKAEYVDGFVNPDEDASIIRVFAGQLGVGEKALREWMVARKLIYRRETEARWSSSQQRLVQDYQWLAYAYHADWFTTRDQPTAPRMHNGQMRTTLYVTPLGKVAIRRLLMKHPIERPAA